MLGYRKRSFERAHELITVLRTNSGELTALKSLQQLLYGEILRTEKKIRFLKGELKGLQRAGGAVAAKRSAYLKRRIEKVRLVAYVWRCFGDAIAFIYLDRFAIKQCYFSTETTRPKSDAGFLSDKEGASTEIATLELVLAKGIPALLVDLTNTLRHGDICLMAESDPKLIEVKTTSGLDRRGRRQRRALDKLHGFFDTDRAEELRGLGDVRRVAYIAPEQSYFDELRKCIAEALINGHAVCEPEEGLQYVAFAAGDASIEGSASIDAVLRSLNLNGAWTFGLNEFKNQRAWSPYLPFTLSITDKDHLWHFIRGEVFLLVFVKSGRLVQIASQNGAAAAFDNEKEEYPLSITFPGSEGPASVSRAFLGRIGMEFASPQWLLSVSREALIEGAKIVLNDA